MNAQTKMSEKGQVVIPKDVRDRLHISPGDRLDVIERPDGIFLRKPAPKSGRSTAEIVAEMRTLYQHDGPAATIDDMNAAIDTLFAEGRHDR
jgi:AbrB family looped-hinge helix DNA binding protein